MCSTGRPLQCSLGQQNWKSCWSPSCVRPVWSADVSEAVYTGQTTGWETNYDLSWAWQYISREEVMCSIATKNELTVYLACKTLSYCKGKSNVHRYFQTWFPLKWHSCYSLTPPKLAGRGWHQDNHTLLGCSWEVQQKRTYSHKTLMCSSLLSDTIVSYVRLHTLSQEWDTKSVQLAMNQWSELVWRRLRLWQASMPSQELTRLAGLQAIDWLIVE